MTDPDRCPGALTLHDAADGPLARVRLPGGRLDPAQLAALVLAAVEFGSGSIELTSRANLQLRAVRDPAGLAELLTGAGLLPSATHERVRNIVASALSGRVGGRADVRPLIDELDAALCGTPELARLPGRVLFGLDDGRGDVGALGPDFGLFAAGGGEFALLLAGADSGVRLGRDGVDRLIAAAAVFGRIRDGAWRLADVPDGAARVCAALGLVPSAAPVGLPPAPAPAIGWLPQDDGAVALGAGLRFGTLDAGLAEFVVAVEHPIVITPGRGLILADLAEPVADTVLRVLAPLGLIFDAESPWLRVSACAGQPGCGNALADVRGDAVVAVERGDHPAGRQHWAGCARRCGRPPAPVTDVVATGAGYRIATDSESG
ncbi:precorrin-3B synthase [Skermania piniformis]|uniref:Precorrin-3B synthase n=1 Tax=Skermania pinensis TaxID=39122 RepID=A0ABX8SDW8_9ACTN|nr:precorrin-3B synthase [Skermania piniformis]QXQ15516.1 precorrin-3B synthase [Skermania piniformis]